MIDKAIADKIQTGVGLNAYLRKNLEVGDVVKSFSGRPYTIIAILGSYYWARHNDETPVTLGVNDMDV